MPGVNVPGPVRITADSIPDEVIEDRHVAEDADIQRDKLEPGSAGHVLINDGSGNPSSEAQLALTRGGTGASTASGARTALGLGGAAVLNVGTTAGTVAAGDDARFPSGAPLVASNNLSDLASASTARTNLGLGTAATHNVPASGDAASGEVVKGSDTRLSDLRTASAVRETSGPTTMTVGAVADGEYLRRSGSALIGGTPSGGGGDQSSGTFVGGVPMSAAVSDRVYLPASPTVATVGAGVSTALNTLYANRIVVPSSLVGIALRVTCHVRAINGSALLRLAVYSATSSTNPYPGARVELGDEIAGVSTATPFPLASFTWTPSAAGVYWLAIVNGTSAASLTHLTTGRNLALEGQISGTTQAFGLTVAYSYAAPPTTFPAGATMATTMPMLYVTRD